MLTHMHKMMIALPEEVLTQLKQAREPGESDDFAAIAAALDTLKEFLERPGNSVSEIVHSPGSHQLGEEVGFLVQLCSLDMCSDIAAAAVTCSDVTTCRFFLMQPSRQRTSKDTERP